MTGGKAFLKRAFERVAALPAAPPPMTTAHGLVDCAIRRPRRPKTRGQLVGDLKLDLSLLSPVEQASGDKRRGALQDRLARLHPS